MTLKLQFVMIDISIIRKQAKSMKKISVKDIEGIRIGNAQNFTGGTGCTVILSETGMCAGLDVRGGGPASRESELLKPSGSCTVHPCSSSRWRKCLRT